MVRDGKEDSSIWQKVNWCGGESPGRPCDSNDVKECRITVMENLQNFII